MMGSPITYLCILVKVSTFIGFNSIFIRVASLWPHVGATLT